MMAVQRKVFRIEQSAGACARDALNASGGDAALRYDAFVAEMRSLRDLIEPRNAVDRDALERSRAQIAEAQAYKAELALIHEAIRRTRDEVAAFGAAAPLPEVARASRELSAVVSGTEQATQKVLQAAEDIDQTANTLSAALKSGHELDLAHDIRDQVVRIFEACNFQDITGQRVGKVIEVLGFLEQHVGRLMEIWRGIEHFKPDVRDEPAADDRRYLNGPKLAGDGGHSSQQDIDLLFAFD